MVKAICFSFFVTVSIEAVPSIAQRRLVAYDVPKAENVEIPEPLFIDCSDRLW